MVISTGNIFSNRRKDVVNGRIHSRFWIRIRGVRGSRTVTKTVFGSEAAQLRLPITFGLLNTGAISVGPKIWDAIMGRFRHREQIKPNRY